MGNKYNSLNRTLPMVGHTRTVDVTSSGTNNTCISITKPKAIILFIGGAGDKKPFAGSGPNRNITYVHSEYIAKKDSIIKKNQKKLIIDDLSICWLGYYEIFGDENIQKSVIDKIPDKNTAIYIIGHSLGGWNGAHLTNRLLKKGYKSKMLITLDPVGKGFLINVADIYYNDPVVIAETWINIRCKPKEYGFSDFVADLGEQWEPNKDQPTYNVITKANHLDADYIITTKVHGNLSALDLLINSLQKVLQC
ncbi:hypothetical protein [Psychrobacter sp. Ps7]|jgi:hypothetical protein|uniref:hypothetical protein n=1 Tax=Psychrobacter sp. Ps7 TaxID=2790961 RepID=UPI001EE0244E|nr:hypothetical protein [Psychrobacter sp. Ps7]MCG3871532.1 alpha/beta hydrolase [Psychrobacter sp. Ps7]